MQFDCLNAMCNLPRLRRPRPRLPPPVARDALAVHTRRHSRRLGQATEGQLPLATLQAALGQGGPRASARLNRAQLPPGLDRL